MALCSYNPNPMQYLIILSTDCWAQFNKPKEGWTCDVCNANNKVDAAQCVVCEAPNPNLSSGATSGNLDFTFGAAAATAASKSESGAGSGIRFGAPAASMTAAGSGDTTMAGAATADSGNSSSGAGLSFGGTSPFGSSSGTTSAFSTTAGTTEGAAAGTGASNSTGIVLCVRVCGCVSPCAYGVRRCGTFGIPCADSWSWGAGESSRIRRGPSPDQGGQEAPLSRPLPTLLHPCILLSLSVSQRILLCTPPFTGAQ